MSRQNLERDWANYLPIHTQVDKVRFVTAGLARTLPLKAPGAHAQSLRAAAFNKTLAKAGWESSKSLLSPKESLLCHF